MKKNTETLQPDTFYHIYNRGVNGTRIFTKRGNADYFLDKYIKYISPIADTFAYVLMGNHFHFLIKTKSEAEVKGFYCSKLTQAAVQNPACVPLPPPIETDKTASYIISKQFSHFFNTYAQSINKQDKRTGPLFEEPFRRIDIDNMDYLCYMVYYIHNNPVKHGFTNDFRLYPYSSFPVFSDPKKTFVQCEAVLSWFGGLEAFMNYHGTNHDFDQKWYDKNWIEID